MATPTAATEPLKKLEDQLTCAICLECYQDPKLLSCLHVFCCKCLQQLVHQGTQGLTVQCPNCRQVTLLPQSGASGILKAFHISHLFNNQSALKKATESQGLLCDKCQLEKASNFCRNCGQFICIACTTVHQTWEELSSHEVITIQQLTSNAAKLILPKKQAMPCPKHPANVLNQYCETCEELACHDCIAQVHRDHQYDLVGDAFPKHKDVIVASLQPVEQQLATVSKALEGLGIRCSQIIEQCQSIETEIQRNIQQLHKVLDVRKQDLIGQLEQVTQQKLKNLAAQRDQFELMETQLRSCCDFVQESLRTGSEAEILAMKKPVVKQMRDMMTTSLKSEALALHEQADIKFSHNHHEVVQACQEFGRIYTHPVCPEKCCVSSPGVAFAVIGETATTTLQAMDQEGQECQRALEDVHSELVSSNGSVRLAAEVKRRGGNKYKISYRPQHKGQHYLHIQVEGKHISGSPFSVMVHSKELTTIKNKGLDGPWGVAVNNRGEIIVAERSGCRISIFSANGERITTFGSQGSGPGQLHYPIGVKVDGHGNILVCDQFNYRIQTFSPSGTFMKAVGTHGSGPLQFQYAQGIATHPHTNKVYVADTGNHHIQVLNEDMSFSSSFGSEGSNSGQFRWPCDVTFDHDGNVYVADRGNHRIQVFTKENKYLREFGGLNPFAVAMDMEDTMYVAEYLDKRISLFTKDGKFLRSIKSLFRAPYGVAVSNGLIYVSYADAKCIRTFRQWTV